MHHCCTQATAAVMVEEEKWEEIARAIASSGLEEAGDEGVSFAQGVVERVIGTVLGKKDSQTDEEVRMMERSSQRHCEPSSRIPLRTLGESPSTPSPCACSNPLPTDTLWRSAWWPSKLAGMDPSTASSTPSLQVKPL